MGRDPMTSLLDVLCFRGVSTTRLYPVLLFWFSFLYTSQYLMHWASPACDQQERRALTFARRGENLTAEVTLASPTYEVPPALSAPAVLSACVHQKEQRNTTATLATNVTDEDSEVEVELGFEMRHGVRPEFRKAMTRYIALHEKIIRRDPSVEHKFVIASPDGQLCNRIRGVVSAFTFAFLTDRAFVINNFGYGETAYSHLFQNPGFDIENTGAAAGEGPTLPMHAGDVSSAELFTCTDWLSNTEKVISMPGASYINTYLYRNPYLQKKIRDLFLDDDIYRPILFWLFRPLPEIVQIKDDFIREKLAGPYLVTFHIRTEFPVTDDEFKAYRDCATSVTPPFHRETARWFVATDTEKARADVLSRLSNSSVFYSPDKFITGSFKEGLRQALVDILIASEGDQIFLTPFSSYSRVIALYAKSPHVYMVSDYVMPEQDPHRTLTKIATHCYRFLSKEDCVWHGHLTSVSEALRGIKCYTPDMAPDYC